MHTIRHINGEWCYVVQFVEFGGESGFRADRDNICWCKTPWAATRMCSWLNGGPEPVDEGIQFNDVKWPE